MANVCVVGTHSGSPSLSFGRTWVGPGGSAPRWCTQPHWCTPPWCGSRWGPGVGGHSTGSEVGLRSDATRLRTMRARASSTSLMYSKKSLVMYSRLLYSFLCDVQYFSFLNNSRIRADSAFFFELQNVIVCRCESLIAHWSYCWTPSPPSRYTCFVVLLDPPPLGTRVWSECCAIELLYNCVCCAMVVFPMSLLWAYFKT